MPNKKVQRPAHKLLIKNVPTLPKSATVQQARDLLNNPTQNFETINYIYLLDKNHHLQGAVSIKEIFHHSKTTKLLKFSPKPLISIREHTDQERAAYQALKYNLKSVPVTDNSGKFLGIIPSDKILEILYEEIAEDQLRQAGITPQPHPPKLTQSFQNQNIPLLTSLKNRVPWLIIGLLGGIVAAAIIHQFEETLNKNLIIAAYIPLVVYIAGAVFTQISSIIIRDLAINPTLKFPEYFRHQFNIVALTSLTISIFSLLIHQLIYQDLITGIIISVSLFSASLSALITGLILPYTLNKFNYDPTNASGPIGTIIQDVSSIIVYFLIATQILNFTT